MREPGLEQDEAPDDMMESVARELRQPVIMDASLDARIMDAVRPVGRRRRRSARAQAAWQFVSRPRPLSPIAALAIAAGIAIIAVLGDRAARQPAVAGVAAQAPEPADPLIHRTAATRQLSPLVTQFTVVAPHAGHVALVGDFNDWKDGATPLVPVGDGVWSVAVPLTPGRYTYMFLVDGRPTPDPATPPALAGADDDFGTPSSVITVGEAP